MQESNIRRDHRSEKCSCVYSKRIIKCKFIQENRVFLSFFSGDFASFVEHVEEGNRSNKSSLQRKEKRREETVNSDRQERVWSACGPYHGE